MSSVYFINFLFCSIFSSFCQFFSFLVCFSLHSSGFKSQRQALLLLSFFNILNKFILYVSLVFLSWSRLACTSFISQIKMILAAFFRSAFADLAREVWWSLYLWCDIFTLNIVPLLISLVCGCRLLETRWSLIKRRANIDSTFMFWASFMFFPLNLRSNDVCPWFNLSKIFTTTASSLYLLISHFLK